MTDEQELAMRRKEFRKIREAGLFSCYPLVGKINPRASVQEARKAWRRKWYIACFKSGVGRWRCIPINRRNARDFSTRRPYFDSVDLKLSDMFGLQVHPLYRD